MCLYVFAVRGLGSWSIEVAARMRITRVRKIVPVWGWVLSWDGAIEPGREAQHWHGLLAHIYKGLQLIAGHP
jgi:hypothetical protein